MEELPSVSIIIPTYNCERTLEKCLMSIEEQDYPKNKIEIIIVDGGSKDKTLEIARRYSNKIFHNPLRTGEAGKAVGVKVAKNEIVAFIDSDNILPSEDWLRKMVKPFNNEEVIGSEPLHFTYREEDKPLVKYFAMLGMNDPLCLFLGNYDRYCYITGKWTEMPVKILENNDDYMVISLDCKHLPTIGANGFLVRREFLYNIQNYLFDVDIVYDLVNKGLNKFAKVKIGIVHLYAENLLMFAKKQKRRITDYFYYKKLRKYPWSTFNKLKLIKFIFYTIFIIPLLFQLVKGLSKKRDLAWIYHIIVCWITLLIYTIVLIKIKTNLNHLKDR